MLGIPEIWTRSGIKSAEIMFKGYTLFNSERIDSVEIKEKEEEAAFVYEGLVCGKAAISRSRLQEGISVGKIEHVYIV